MLKYILTEMKKGTRKAGALKKLWKDERFSCAKALFLRKILRVLKEILPVKGEAILKYGANDPYKTGKATSIYLLFTPILGDFLKFEPDFNGEILEGRANISGRVRLYFLVESFLSIFFNRKLRILYKKTREILDF